jgi:hypothetical protein
MVVVEKRLSLLRQELGGGQKCENLQIIEFIRPGLFFLTEGVC